MIYSLDSDQYYNFLIEATKMEKKWTRKNAPPSKQYEKMSYIDMINNN